MRPSDRLLVVVETLRAWYGVSPTQDELAAFTGVSQGTVYHRLERLKASGLVRKTEGVARSVQLTPEGYERLDIVLPVVRPELLP